MSLSAMQAAAAPPPLSRCPRCAAPLPPACRASATRALLLQPAAGRGFWPGSARRGALQHQQQQHLQQQQQQRRRQHQWPAAAAGEGGPAGTEPPPKPKQQFKYCRMCGGPLELVLPDGNWRHVCTQVGVHMGFMGRRSSANRTTSSLCVLHHCHHASQPQQQFAAPQPSAVPVCGLPKPSHGGGHYCAARGAHPAVPPWHRAAARPVDRAGRWGDRQGLCAYVCEGCLSLLAALCVQGAKQVGWCSCRPGELCAR